MLYEQLILDSYKSLGKDPREGQLETINEILTQFINKGKKNVVLDAPTGTGKSIIGAVTAECIGRLRSNIPANAILLSSTNLLLDQYAETFPKDPRFSVMKGAENYICKLKSNGPVKVMANNCLRKTKFFKNEDQTLAKTTCNTCSFALSRLVKNTSRNIITNYAFYFLDRLYMAKLDKDRADPLGFTKRNIIVWDEAHMINEAFVGHCQIYFSKERANEYLGDCEKYFSSSARKWHSELKSILDLIASGVTFTADTVLPVLETLAKFYAFMRDGFEDMASRSESFSQYQANFKFFDKYKGLFCKINNYTDFLFEIVIDTGDKKEELKISPIFVSTMFPQVENSEFNLFMSATVSAEYLIQTLGLAEDNTVGVKARNVFNISDKRVVISKDLMESLNHKALQEDLTYRSIAGKISKLSVKHREQNGVIFAPSFAFIKKLAPHLKTSHKVIMHDRGPLIDALKEFKAEDGQAKILISPSIYEGVDLPGKVSEFQIFTKAPYVSLGDKRVAYILDRYPDVYEIMTIMRMIQGLGRSTRFKGDACTTYFLDSNLRRLFHSPRNAWEEQFLVASSV